MPAVVVDSSVLITLAAGEQIYLPTRIVSNTPPLSQIELLKFGLEKQVASTQCWSKFWP